MATKVGEIYVEITGDASHLLADLEKTKAGMVRVAQEGMKMGDNLSKSLSRSGTDLQNLPKMLDGWINRVKSATPENTQFAKSIAEVTEAYKRGRLSAGEAEKALEGIKAQMQAAAGPAKTFGDSIRESGKDLSGLSGSVDRWAKNLAAATPQNIAWAESLDRITNEYKSGKISAEDAAKGVARIRGEMDRAAKEAAGFTGKFGGLKEAFHNIGSKVSNAVESITGFNLATLGSAAAIGMLARGAKVAIDAASDLNETVSKTQVVFGKSSETMLRFGEDAAKSMGMSKNEALAAASTFGNLFVSMGMTSGKSADMSKSLVQLAADLASFNNMDSGEVLEKLRAGLTGESEPLKSLGVNINEAVIKSRAMEMGLIGVNGELSASAKAQAAYSLILQQTATAQGDFARTADGLANSQRILNAQLADAKAQVGQNLLPPWLAVVKTVASATGAMNDWGAAYNKANSGKKDTMIPLVGTFIGIARAIKEVNAESNRMSGDAIDAWAARYQAAAEKAQSAISSVDPLALSGKPNENYDQIANQMRGIFDASDKMRESFNSTREAEVMLSNTTSDLSYAYGLVIDTMQNMDADEYTATMQKMADSTKQVEDAQRALADATESFSASYSDKVAGAMETAGIKGEKYTKALEMLDRQNGTNLLGQFKANEALDKAIAAYGKTGDIEAFSSAIGSNKTEWENLDASVQQAKTDLEEARTSFNNLVKDIATASGKSWTITVSTGATGGPGAKDTGAVKNKAPAGNTPGAKTTVSNTHEYATGGDFTVPAGYPNDTYQMAVSTGEHVTVTPPGKTAPTAAPGVTINGLTISVNAGNNPNGYQLGYQIYTALSEAAQQAGAGAGYAGGG